MKRHFFSIALFFSLILSGCTAAGGTPDPAVKQFFAMDTLMRLEAYGPQGEAAVQAAQTELERLEELLSRTRADSQVSRLNACAGDGSWVPLAPEVAALLEEACTLSGLLPGCFDVTIAPVMDAWGFAGAEFQVPGAEVLAERLALVDWQKLQIDAAQSAARLERAGMAVDLGAAAKGFAAGRAAQAIQDAGVSSALLDLGGNITVLGDGPNGPSWRVAVKDPNDTSTYLGVVSMRDQTASTSGGYERYFEADGVRYHHIIDPETGYPAEAGLVSVTVISENPLLADILSTALFVAGRDAALEFWRSRTGFELVLCGQDGVVTVTEGLDFQFEGERNGYTCEIVAR